MEAAKRFFKTRKNGAELGLGELWASGAFAGTVNTVVANPVEHIRIRTSVSLALINQMKGESTKDQDYKHNQLPKSIMVPWTVYPNCTPTVVSPKSLGPKYHVCSEMGSEWDVTSSPTKH